MRLNAWRHRTSLVWTGRRLSRVLCDLLLRAAFSPENCLHRVNLETGPRVICLPDEVNVLKDNGNPATSTEACSSVNSLAVTGVETTGVTSFVSEACNASMALGAAFYAPTSAPPQADLQDVKAYFGRPRVVINFATVPGSENVQYEDVVTWDRVLSTFFPYGKSRLIGAYGLRATLVFTVQINATPFQQGLIAATWQYGLTTITSTTAGITPRGSVPGMQTYLPHSLLDLAASTMCQLKVPFLNVQEFASLDDTSPYGVFSVATILPILIGTGANIPMITVYVHLEDIEIYGATMPESSTITLQSGVKSVLAKEMEDEGFPFSSSMHAFSRSLTYLSKGVPSLSSFLGPPAWAAGQAARLIRYFGFAKPQIQEPPTRMLIQSHVNETNVDVASATGVVGPFISHTLAISPEAGHTQVDEMALPYILGQYGQLCRGYWNSADGAAICLYATQVSPSSFWFRSRISGTRPSCNVMCLPLARAVDRTAFVPTNIFWIASLFRQWKGSFRFRVTFAKTKFHTGRVVMTFDPRPVPSTSFPSTTASTVLSPLSATLNQPTSYSVVFDLKDGNSFEFEVPYVSTLPYQSFFDNIGSLTMSAMTNLNAPSTVNASVQFLVEVMAMPDFEVADYVSPRYPPIDILSAATVQYQSGTVVANTSTRDAELCVGEKFMSVKQLIQIPKVANCGNIPANSGDSLYLMPWWFSNRNFGSTVTPLTSWSRETFGIGGYISRAYAFVRGSTDVHFYIKSPGAADFYVTATPITNNSAFYGNLADATNTPGSSIPRVTTTTTQCGFHIRLPAHQRCVRYLSSVLLPITWVPSFQNAAKVFSFPPTKTAPLEFYRITADNVSGADTQCYLTRAAADDAGCFGYIGPPCLGLLFAPTSTTVYDPDTGPRN